MNTLILVVILAGLLLLAIGQLMLSRELNDNFRVAHNALERDVTYLEQRISLLEMKHEAPEFRGSISHWPDHSGMASLLAGER
ncbi:hypothetical protein AALI21_02870 [Corynebacteriaceae bacterium 6-324]